MNQAEKDLLMRVAEILSANEDIFINRMELNSLIYKAETPAQRALRIERENSTTYNRTGRAGMSPSGAKAPLRSK